MIEPGSSGSVHLRRCPPNTRITDFYQIVRAGHNGIRKKPRRAREVESGRIEILSGRAVVAATVSHYQDFADSSGFEAARNDRQPGRLKIHLGSWRQPAIGGAEACLTVAATITPLGDKQEYQKFESGGCSQH
jgi:hypothetical protein